MKEGRECVFEDGFHKFVTEHLSQRQSDYGIQLLSTCSVADSILSCILIGLNVRTFVYQVLRAE